MVRCLPVPSSSSAHRSLTAATEWPQDSEETGQRNDVPIDASLFSLFLAWHVSIQPGACLGIQKPLDFSRKSILGLDVGEMRGIELQIFGATNVGRKESSISGRRRRIMSSGDY